MDLEAFGQYLIKNNILRIEQVEHCLQSSQMEEVRFLELLKNEFYFSDERLQSYVKDFQELRKMYEFQIESAKQNLEKPTATSAEILEEMENFHSQKITHSNQDAPKTLLDPLMQSLPKIEEKEINSSTPLINETVLEKSLSNDSTKISKEEKSQKSSNPLESSLRSLSETQKEKRENSNVEPVAKLPSADSISEEDLLAEMEMLHQKEVAQPIETSPLEKETSPLEKESEQETPQEKPAEKEEVRTSETEKKTESASSPELDLLAEMEILHQKESPNSVETSPPEKQEPPATEIVVVEETLLQETKKKEETTPSESEEKLLPEKVSAPPQEEALAKVESLARLKEEDKDLLGEMNQLSQQQQPAVQQESLTSKPITDRNEKTIVTPITVQASNVVQTKGVEQPTPSENALQNRYDIIELLGEGGMGVVQLAKDKTLEREIALKRIKMAPEGFEKLSEIQQIMLWRLGQEAEINANLEHPNIVPVYDMQQQANGEIYFTMRKVEGKTLKQLLFKISQKQEDHDSSRLLSIFLKVCDAVSYAHSRKIIHRDLKPENIMVGAFGNVYVMDWGIAKQLGQNIEASFISSTFIPTTNSYQTIGGIGTPGYMSPEQEKNANQVIPQSDVYALGVILRQCFTLLSPEEEFNLRIAQDQRKLESVKSQNEFKAKEEVLEDLVPIDIRAICLKATKENWKDRYQTVGELADDIRQYLQQGRVSARKYGFFELLLKWGKKNRFGILFLFALSIISVALYSVLLNRNKFQKELAEKRLAQNEREYLQNAISSNADEKKKLAETQNRLNLLLSSFENKKSSAEKSAEFYLTRGNIYLQKRRLQQAALDFQEAIKIAEKTQEMLLLFNAHWKRGNSLQKLAQADFLQAIPLQKAVMNHYEKAIQLYKNNNLVDPAIIRVNSALGSIHQLKAEFKEAFIYYDKACRLLENKEVFDKANFNPDLLKEIYKNRGKIYQKLPTKRWQKAISDFNQALQLAPKEAELYFLRAISQKELGNYMEAKEDCNLAISYDKKYWDGYLLRAECSFLLPGTIKSVALQDVELFLRNVPKYLPHYNSLEKSYYRSYFKNYIKMATNLREKLAER